PDRRRRAELSRALGEAPDPAGQHRPDPRPLPGAAGPPAGDPCIELVLKELGLLAHLLDELEAAVDAQLPEDLGVVALDRLLAHAELVADHLVRAALQVVADHGALGRRELLAGPPTGHIRLPWHRRVELVVGPLGPGARAERVEHTEGVLERIAS